MITSFSGNHRFLSNFYPSTIVYKGVTFPTVEHAYQAAKSTDPNDLEMFSKMKTPSMAKQQGRCVPIREDWDKIKTNIMTTLVLRKFWDNDLAQLLRATGTQELIEGNTWGDCIWGQCPIGTGENKLGKILMNIRRAL